MIHHQREIMSQAVLFTCWQLKLMCSGVPPIRKSRIGHPAPAPSSCTSPSPFQMGNVLSFTHTPAPSFLPRSFLTFSSPSITHHLLCGFSKHFRLHLTWYSKLSQTYLFSSGHPSVLISSLPSLSNRSTTSLRSIARLCRALRHQGFSHNTSRYPRAPTGAFSLFYYRL